MKYLLQRKKNTVF